MILEIVNQTGGTLVNSTVSAGQLYQSYGMFLNTTYYIGPGTQPVFTKANAYTWEGGRGVRCDFWRGLGGIVPE